MTGHRARRSTTGSCRASSAQTRARPTTSATATTPASTRPGVDRLAGLHGARSSSTTSTRSGSGCSSDQYAQIEHDGAGDGRPSPVTTTALAGPQVGSRGLESGRFLLHGVQGPPRRSGDSAHDPARRRPNAAAARGHVQRVQHGRLQRPPDAGPVQQRHRPDRPELAVPARTARWIRTVRNRTRPASAPPPARSHCARSRASSDSTSDDRSIALNTKRVGTIPTRFFCLRQKLHGRRGPERGPQRSGLKIRRPEGRHAKA